MVRFELDEKAWVALCGIMSDYIFLSDTIIQVTQEFDIKVDPQMIDDLEHNKQTAGNLLDQLMGEPENKTVN